MININLKVKPAPRLSWRRVLGALGVGSMLLAMAAHAVTWWSEVQQAQADLAAVAPLEAAYRKVMESAGPLKEREAVLGKQKERLTEIGRNQGPGGQSAVLRAVFAAAPPGVTLTELTVEQGGSLVITGQAPDFVTAMKYLQALHGLSTLAGVQERKLAAPVKGVTTFTFAAQMRRGGAQ